MLVGGGNGGIGGWGEVGGEVVVELDSTPGVRLSILNLGSV